MIRTRDLCACLDLRVCKGQHATVVSPERRTPSPSGYPATEIQVRRPPANHGWRPTIVCGKKRRRRIAMDQRGHQLTAHPGTHGPTTDAAPPRPRCMTTSFTCGEPRLRQLLDPIGKMMPRDSGTAHGPAHRITMIATRGGFHPPGRRLTGQYAPTRKLTPPEKGWLRCGRRSNPRACTDAA